MKNCLLLVSILFAINAQAVDLISINAAGLGSGESDSQVPKTSADGRYVAFYSASTDLVSGQVDTNGTLDIFLRDTLEHTTVLVSHASSSTNTAGNDVSVLNDISNDGRYVAFTSLATNLVSGFSDNNAFNSDIFVYDRQDQSIKLVSGVSGSTTSGSSGHSNLAYISPDGSKIVFTSLGGNIVSGFTDNNGGFSSDVFLHFIASNTTVLVSHSSSSLTAGANGNAFTVPGGFSGDGSKLLFTSASTNLISGGSDTNASLDVFLYNVNDSSNSLVSHVPGNSLSAGNGGTIGPVISYDGSTVAFQSTSSNLVSGFVDHNGGSYDVYKYLTSSGVNSLLSHSTASALDSGNAESTAPAISYNGNVIAYASAATDLVSGITDSNSGVDIFAANSGTNELVSASSSGTSTGNFASSGTPIVSYNGRKIAFLTLAANLSSLPDSNSVSDYYVRDIVSDVTALAITNQAGTQASGSGSSELVMNRNGYVVTSYSTDILSSDSNGALADVFFNFSDLVDVSSPASAIYVDSDSTTITGTAESGSLVKIYEDTDADGVKDDGEVSVAEEQLAEGASAFSISTPITINSANHFFVVSADPLDIESFPEQVPAITDVPTYKAKLLKNKPYITLKITDEDNVVLLNKKPFGKKSGKAKLSRKDFNGDGILDIQVRATINGKAKRQRYSGVDLSKL